MIGEFFKIMSGYLPAPPGYASPPPLWGNEDHVRDLFADTGVDLTFAYGHNPWRFDSAEHWVSFLETAYGPTVKARERLTGEGRWDACRAEIVAMAERRNEAADGKLLLPRRVPHRPGPEGELTAVIPAPALSPISRSSRAMPSSRASAAARAKSSFALAASPGLRAGATPPPARHATARRTGGRASAATARAPARTSSTASSAPVLDELKQPERVRDRSERRGADPEDDPEVAERREQRLGRARPAPRRRARRRRARPAPASARSSRRAGRRRIRRR